MIKGKNVRIVVLAVLLIVFIPFSMASAVVNRYMDCESATIDSSTGKMTDNGYTFYNNREGAYVTPYFSSTARKGSNSVVMKVNSTPSGGTKDRNEYYINNNSPLNTEKYTGFSFRISSSSAYPTNWTLLKQFFQYDTDNTSVSPPIALEFKYNVGKFQLRAVYRGGNTSNPTVTVVDLQDINTDTWYDVVINWKVSNSANNGIYRLFINGTKVLDRSGITIGYTNLGGCVFDKIGVYRGAQTGTMLVYLDQVRQGDTWNEVNPAN